MVPNLPLGYRIADILEYLKEYHNNSGGEGQGPISSSCRFPWVVDINTHHPLEFMSVVEEPFWFFTSVVPKSKSGRKNHRSTSCGYGRWRGTSKVKEVTGGPTNNKRKIGELRNFEFRVKINPPCDKGDVKTEFLMMEYRALISDGILSRVAFCSIYTSPRARARAHRNCLPPTPAAAAAAVAAAASDVIAVVVSDQQYCYYSQQPPEDSFQEEIAPLLNFSDSDDVVNIESYLLTSSSPHKFDREDHQLATFDDQLLFADLPPCNLDEILSDLDVDPAAEFLR